VKQVHKAWPWIAGLGAALLYAGGLYLLTRGLFPASGMAIGAFLIGTPAGACVLISFLSDPTGRRGAGHHAGMGALAISACLIGSIVIFREGGICIIMASPLFYGAGLLASVATGAVLRRLSGDRDGAPPESYFCVSALVILPLVILPLERQMQYPRVDGSETSTVVINATPDVVWSNLAQLRDIRRDEQVFDFSHSLAGIPRPVDAQLEGAGPGAVRHIRWTRDLHFDEVVDAWEPGKRLAWRFHFARNSIPLTIERNINLNGDYLRLTGGDYRLDALPGGRTRLTLQTRYWIKTPINTYCKVWGRVFLGDIHGAVLRVIRKRSEAQASTVVARAN